MFSRSLAILSLLATSLVIAHSQTTPAAANVGNGANSGKTASRTAPGKGSARGGRRQTTVESQLLELRGEMQRQHAEMQQQIQDLKQQLAESRQQITQTQQALAVTTQTADRTEQASRTASASSDQAVASLQGAVSDLRGNSASLAATLKESQAATKAAIENPLVIHYRGVRLNPGGFVAAESVWRQHQLQADVASPFNSIPFDGSTLARLGEFRLSARQSRMNVLAEANPGGTSLAGFFEFDMLGAGLTSNSTESNSYLPRLRHAWVRAAWENGWSMAAGQMWTLAMSNRNGISAFPGNVYLPDMIDAQYVVGVDWLRQPALRVVRNFGNRVWIAASAEGAQTTFSARNAPANFLFVSPGTANLTTTVNYSFNAAPDLIAKIAIEPGFGHYEAKAIGRFFRDRVYPEAPSSTAGAYNDKHFGGGVGATAAWSIAKQVDLGVNAVVGNGIGRYGTSQLPDVTVRPDGTLALIHGGQALVTADYNPTPRLKIYAYGGDEYADRTAFLGPTGLGIGYGSPRNNNTGCQVETVPATYTAPAAGTCNADTRTVFQAVLGFWYRAYVGPLGRVQYGLQSSYTRRETWSGIGGAPKGSDVMIFTSTRYYLP